MQNFSILTILGRSAGCFKSCLVGNPKDRFYHAKAHLLSALFCQHNLKVYYVHNHDHEIVFHYITSASYKWVSMRETLSSRFATYLDPNQPDQLETSS